MSKMSVPEAIKEMVGTQNTFSVGFYPNNFLVAYDMQKKGYRNINYNTIKYIKAKGMIYHIEVENTDEYRLMFVGAVDVKDAN